MGFVNCFIVHLVLQFPDLPLHGGDLSVVVLDLLQQLLPLLRRRSPLPLLLQQAVAFVLHFSQLLVETHGLFLHVGHGQLVLQGSLFAVQGIHLLVHSLGVELRRGGKKINFIRPRLDL